MHAAATSQQTGAGIHPWDTATNAIAPVAAKTTLAKEIVFGRTPRRTSHSEAAFAHAVERDLSGRRDVGRPSVDMRRSGWENRPQEKPAVRFKLAPTRVLRHCARVTGLWCNGNTAAFGAVIHGSSPCGPASPFKSRSPRAHARHSLIASAIRMSSAPADRLEKQNHDQGDSHPEPGNQRPCSLPRRHLPEPSPVHGEMHRHEGQEGIPQPCVKIPPLVPAQSEHGQTLAAP